MSYPTGKGGEFYIENSLSTDSNAEDAANQDNQRCNAIAKLRKSGGNTILPGTYKATVDYEGGKCGFSVIFPETKEAITDLGEIQCFASQDSVSMPSIKTPAEITDQALKGKPVPATSQAMKKLLFAYPDAE